MYTRLMSLACLLTLLAIVGCDSGASKTPAPASGPNVNSPEYKQMMMQGMQKPPGATEPAIGEVKPTEGDAKSAEEKPSEKPAADKPAEEKKE